MFSSHYVITPFLQCAAFSGLNFQRLVHCGGVFFSFLLLLVTGFSIVVKNKC